MIEENRQRLIIKLDDLRKKNSEQTKAMISNFGEEKDVANSALTRYVNSINTTYASKFDEFFLGSEGAFGKNHVTPRTSLSNASRCGSFHTNVGFRVRLANRNRINTSFSFFNISDQLVASMTQSSR